MAGTPSSSLHRFKLQFLLVNPGRDVLTFILKCSTNALTSPPGIQLDEYLYQLPDSSNANYVLCGQKGKRKKLFNPYEMHQIENDHLWNNFDIPLLYKAIRLAGEDIASDNDAWKDPTLMEGLIQEIIDERNALIHEMPQLTEPEFQAKVNKLEDLFVKALDAAKTKYNVSEMELTPVKDNVLLDFRKMKQMEMEKERSKELWLAKVPDFIQESQNHLKGRYKRAQYIDPLSFLTNSPQGEIDRNKKSSKIFLIQEGEKRDMDSCDILTLAQPGLQSAQPSASQATQSSQDNKPQLIMIRGISGSGKTTLLTYMLSEWLQNVSCCTIKHLNKYDIVLRILCREKDGPLLQDFLKLTLPDIFSIMDEYLVTLLKKCKVLFLIDGIDELSPGSSPHQLVSNIINIGKDVPGFTIICTSRPERVKDFLDKVPGDYKKWEMEMKGISREDKSDFVLKYYNSLPPSSNKDPDTLKYLMESFQWKDYLGLPLNLLFLATLFYNDPQSIKSNDTQTRLYLNIHKWCVVKLQSRLRDHPKVEKDRMAREDAINMVLQDLNKLALKGLLEDRLRLSQEDTRLLRNICEAKKLPSTEVMGAFLCLQEIDEGMVLHQEYSAPHKNIQEFYAAKYVVHKLEEGSQKRTIQRLLDNPSQEQLKKLRNLLKHVAGLLSQPETPPLPNAIKEVVALLAQTGMKNCEEWLYLLDHLKLNRLALECVAGHIGRNDGERVRITDGNIKGAAALLPKITTKEIIIDLNKRQRVLQGLLCQHHKFRWLDLWYHYREARQDDVCDCDSHLFAVPRSHLSSFTGHLSTEAIKRLREFPHLVCVRLSVSDGQDLRNVVSAINEVGPSLPSLGHLALHVPVRAVTPVTISTRMPDVPCGVNLVLTQVDDTVLDDTCKLAEALQPSEEGYRLITFPGSSRLTANTWRQTVEGMGKAGVRVYGGVWVPKTCPLTDEEVEEMTRLVATKMGEDEHGAFEKWHEDNLWLT